MLVEPTSQFLHADGSIVMKWPWWRGVRGELKVTGQRLDASAPPAIGYYDVKGYGLEGFQAGAIIFPGEGCWEITGQVVGASLTFTILVIKIPFEPFEPNWLPEGMLVKDKKVVELPTTIQEIYGVPIWDQDMVSWDEGELVIETSHGVSENLPSYPHTNQLSIVVMGEPGTCVQGAWNKQGQWQTEADAAILEWSSDRFSYRISHTGLGLTCEDLLRIAGSSS